jgi:hypothetical protein
VASGERIEAALTLGYRPEKPVFHSNEIQARFGYNTTRKNKEIQ